MEFQNICNEIVAPFFCATLYSISCVVETLLFFNWLLVDKAFSDS